MKQKLTLIGIGLVAVLVGAAVAPKVVKTLSEQRRLRDLERAHRSYEVR